MIGKHIIIDTKTKKVTTELREENLIEPTPIKEASVDLIELEKLITWAKGKGFKSK